MSALTDLFSAMANKIRSKTGTQTTYTPSEMVSDGIDDVFDAGVASVPTPTSITPSNSSPVALTANTAVKPTASGYAIASYTNIVPSNITPKSLKGKGIYRIDQGSAMSIEGYAISDYETITPSTTNRAYNQSSVNTFKKIDTRAGYIYGAIPTGRILFSCMLGNLRTSTGWEKVSFTAKTVYDEDGTSASVCMDENFAHFDDNGQIVVDRAIQTAYLAGYSPRGVTSSGTAVYGGVAFYKNGTLISGASSYGSSSTPNPNFRRVQTSFAVGDVISIYTRVSSTTQAYVRSTCSIVTP